MHNGTDATSPPLYPLDVQIIIETSARRTERRILGWLEDAGLLLLLAFTFPLVILVVGAPIGLVVRLLMAIGRRWW